MISDLWTLELDGVTKTVAEWGFTSGTIDRGSRVAQSLTLSLPVADVGAHAELAAWEDLALLYRDEELFFRGFLADTDYVTSSDGDEQVYTFLSVWWFLSRTDLAQQWETLDGQKLSARVQYGWRTDQVDHSTTREVLDDLRGYAAAAGVAFSLDEEGLPEIACPPIEATNATVAEIIQRVMEYHPDATLYEIPEIVDSEAATRLVASPVSASGAIMIDASGRPLSDFSIKPRPDMVPDAVHVFYELATPQINFSPADEEEGTPETLSTVTKVLLDADVYPAAADLTRNSVTMTIPVRLTEDLFSAGPTPSVTVTKVPVTVAPLPRTGAFDLAAEQFWLDESPLGNLGITVNDIILPRASTDEIKVHTIKIKESAIPPAPNTINPNAEPSYKTTDLDDLPNYFLQGGYYDFMAVYAMPVEAFVSLGVKKSAVDALPAADAESINRMSSRTVDIAGIEALILDVSTTVLGTDAVTKEYSTPESYNPGGLTQEQADELNQALIAEALAAAKIPGLAQHVYETRQHLPHEGSFSLTEEEAGGKRFLGSVINIVHESRPAWATMRAQVQKERISLETGETSISVGPPVHLAPQDWLQLHSAARAAQRSGAVAALGPQSRGNANF